MTVTQSPNRRRELQVQRDAVSAQRTTLVREHQEAERAHAQARAARAAGTASVRDVSVCQLDVEVLAKEIADKDRELEQIDNAIAEIGAEAEAKRLHRERVKRIALASEKGTAALAEFESARQGASTEVERAFNAFQQQVESQRTIATSIRELLSEGLTLEQVLDEVAGAGADLTTCNVSFGTKRFPSGQIVENGERPLGGFVGDDPIIVKAASETQLMSPVGVVDTALRTLGVPLAAP